MEGAETETQALGREVFALRVRISNLASTVAINSGVIAGLLAFEAIRHVFHGVTYIDTLVGAIVIGTVVAANGYRKVD